MTRKRSDMVEFLNVKIVFAKLQKNVQRYYKVFFSRKLNKKGKLPTTTKVECKARFETVGHGGGLRQCHRVPIFFFTSE